MSAHVKRSINWLQRNLIAIWPEGPIQWSTSHVRLNFIWKSSQTRWFLLQLLFYPIIGGYAVYYDIVFFKNLPITHPLHRLVRQSPRYWTCRGMMFLGYIGRTVLLTLELYLGKMLAESFNTLVKLYERMSQLLIRFLH